MRRRPRLILRRNRPKRKGSADFSITITSSSSLTSSPSLSLPNAPSSNSSFSVAIPFSLIERRSLQLIGTNYFSVKTGLNRGLHGQQLGHISTPGATGLEPNSPSFAFMSYPLKHEGKKIKPFPLLHFRITHKFKA